MCIIQDDQSAYIIFPTNVGQSTTFSRPTRKREHARAGGNSSPLGIQLLFMCNHAIGAAVRGPGCKLWHASPCSGAQQNAALWTALACRITCIRRSKLPFIPLQAYCCGRCRDSGCRRSHLLQKGCTVAPAVPQHALRLYHISAACNQYPYIS